MMNVSKSVSSADVLIVEELESNSKDLQMKKAPYELKYANREGVHIISDEEEEGNSVKTGSRETMSQFSESDGFAGFPEIKGKPILEKPTKTQNLEFPQNMRNDSIGIGETDVETPQKRKRTSCVVEDPPYIETANSNMDNVIEIVSVSSNQRNTRNKFSESSSELPVSTPSDHDVDGEFMSGILKRSLNRPSLLKNNLPADSFERILANIAVKNPQLVFEEKIHLWCCSSDLSDVEDVNNFDDLFKNHQDELRGKKIPQSKRRSSSTNCSLNSDLPKYDYKYFRNEILKDCMGNGTTNKVIDNKITGHRSKWTKSVDSDRKQQASGSSGSKHNKVLPSLLSSMTPLNVEGVHNSHSTAVQAPAQVVSLSSNDSQNNIRMSIAPQIPRASSHERSPYRRIHHWNEEEILLRKNRINPDIEKFNNTHGIIKMRYDYAKEFSLKEKMVEVFKTPMLPQKNTISGIFSDSNHDLTHENSKQSSPELCQYQSPGYRQDEFCNYLGLTGMNNNSMNKKLKKSPLARRSLRVRQMQQQDFDLSKKIPNALEKNNNLMRHNVISEKINGFGNSTREKNFSSSGKKQNYSPPINNKLKEPEIKIVYQIEAKKKPSNNSIQVRRTSLPRKLSLVKNSSPMTTERMPQLRRLRTRNTSNGASTCPRSSRSDVTTPLLSPSTPITIEAMPEKKSKVYPKTPSANKTRTCRRLTRQSYMTTGSGIQSESIPSEKESFTAFDKVKRPTSCNNEEKTVLDDEDDDDDELLKRNHLANGVYEKFQKFLKESRQVKPSIFIVQSMDSVKTATTNESLINPDDNKGKKNNLNNHFQSENSIEILTNNENEINANNQEKRNGNWSSARKKKKRILRRRFFTRSHATTTTIIGGFNNQHRILRNRKVIAKKTARPRSQLVNVATSSADQVSSKLKPMISIKSRKVPSSLSNHNNSVSLLMTNSHQDPEEIVDSQQQTLSATNPPPQIKIISIIPNSTNTTTTMTTPISTISVGIATTLDAKDVETQTEVNADAGGGIKHLTLPSNPQQNPLKFENGPVRHAYYELDILIVVQEFVVSFWKTHKMINILNQATTNNSENSNLSDEWVLLGDVKRLLHDLEIVSQYPNRICIHNSMPIYVEMRTKQFHSNGKRECNLISLYINVYYFNDDENLAKMHSIHLDNVTSIPSSVVYTTITDSRYFVMSFAHETTLGKSRSGLCKYSLTPHLDTLASIREFKSLRHEIHYLEFIEDDKLVGFGETQVTVWDHRTGDILMNYDLDMKLGRNLGTIYFPSFEIGQNNNLWFFQYYPSTTTTTTAKNDENDSSIGPPEVKIIACTISHNAPSHRIMYKHKLPICFNHLHSAMYTGEHLIMTAENDEEIWITSSDPKLLTHLPAQSSQRFYTRCRQHLIEITDTSLVVDSLSNHVLKIAATTTRTTTAGCYVK